MNVEDQDDIDLWTIISSALPQWPRSLRWKNKLKHCSNLKDKPKSTDYKISEQGQWCQLQGISLYHAHTLHHYHSVVFMFKKLYRCYSLLRTRTAARRGWISVTKKLIIFVIYLLTDFLILNLSDFYSSNCATTVATGSHYKKNLTDLTT